MTTLFQRIKRFKNDLLGTIRAFKDSDMRRQSSDLTLFSLFDDNQEAYEKSALTALENRLLNSTEPLPTNEELTAISNGASGAELIQVMTKHFANNSQYNDLDDNYINNITKNSR